MTAEPSSDVALILEGLATEGRMPREALADAVARWDECVPVFIDMIERRPGMADATDEFDNALFLIVHLCGQMRETRAYRPLLGFLSADAELVEDLLGDALTETLPKVMAAVFDGDAAPLFSAILQPDANMWARDSLIEALARVTRDGRVPREVTAAFLARCDTELMPREDNHAWVGWQEAIAVLGLSELKEAVARAFADERVDPDALDYEHFEADLEATLAGGTPSLLDDTPLRDAAEAFAGWGTFTPRPARSTAKAGPPPGTVTNPFRTVGRNDPCPCGSGKKYKACCLA
jgi:uncharacterized protein